MSTKGQLITSVLSEVGRTDLTTAAAEWFDDVYQTVSSFHDWSCLDVRATRASAVNLYRVALPSDCRKVKTVYLDTGDANSRKLVPCALAEFTRLHPRPESESIGKPTNYAEYNGKLLLAPPCQLATWTLSLIYTYNPSNIADGDTPVFPAQFYQAIRAGLRAFAYSHIREYEKSDKNFTRLKDFLELEKKSDEDSRDDELFLQPFLCASTPPSEYWARPEIMRVA